MNLEEYEKVKDFTYLQYCDYLQKKYGIGLSNFLRKSWTKDSKCTRTKDGLLAHHKYEDHAILLSNPAIAKLFPYEWQMAENIVYCDYLEHLLLHVLICQYPSPDAVELFQVGIGGVLEFLVPELNDFYSGWVTAQPWRANCHNRIANDKAVYLAILKRFKEKCSDCPGYTQDCLYTSFNEHYGLWSKERNLPLFKEIANL